MAVVLGTSSGFVIVVPTADPAGTNTTIDGSSVITKHTSPEGANAITEIGWYRGAGTNTANFEVALYADNAGVAGARLFVDNTNSSAIQGWIITTVNWAISANTPYWLAVQMDAHTGSSSIDSETTGGAGSDVLTAQTTLNDPYGGGAVADADGMYAIYAKVSVARNITAGVGDLSVNGFGPSVFATDNKNITPDVGSLTVNGFAPAISVTQHLNIAPGFGDMQISGFNPVIETPRTISADTGQLTINGFAPSIETPVNVSVSTGELTFIGFSPNVTTGDSIDIQTGSGDLLINGFAPTIIIPVGAEPGSGVVTITGFSPTIETPTNVSPDFGQIFFTGFEPIISAGGEVFIEADFGKLIINGFSPVVTSTRRVFILRRSKIKSDESKIARIKNEMKKSKIESADLKSVIKNDI